MNKPENAQIDYSKLKGRIVEICGSKREFARKANLSEESLKNKLKGESWFTQGDIIKIVDVLKIKDCEIPLYFFS